MDCPEVSIIITNYNYSKYLRTCVESCISQTGFSNYEIIIVDDGSTDRSIDHIRPFIGDKVRLIERMNGGIESASNEGIAFAQGKYVVRLDADDYLFPNFLQILMPAMDDQSIAFTYSNYLVVDSEGAELYSVELPEFRVQEIRSRGDFLASGTIYRKSEILAVGGYNESKINCGLENYELILKLLQNGSIGLHLPKQLFAYRRHGMNVSDTRRNEIIGYGYELFTRMGLGHYRTNSYHPYQLKVGNEQNSNSGCAS